jgi:LacI family transcriptional regulator
LKKGLDKARRKFYLCGSASIFFLTKTEQQVVLPSMGVTIYDLARAAGVGIGTVSRCLNNHPHVAPRTRAKVLSAARRLNYQPHAQAQRLASRRTNTISVIIPSFTNYFFVQILQGVQDLAAEVGMDLILYGVNHPSQVEQYLRRSLHRGHVDGVMFFSMKLPESYVTKFQQMQLPLVLVDASHPAFDSIRVKNLEGGLAATRHLLRLGHRSIAMINASLDSQPAQDRMAGYRMALAEAGIPFREDRVIVSSIGKQDGFNREAGRVSMRLLLDGNSGPDAVTAVFAASDVQAIGALEAARESGARIPEDMAMVSFDDIELAQYAELTTMRQPMYEMGRLAMEKLYARMKESAGPPTLTEFLPHLVVRRSCGASLREDAGTAPGVVPQDSTMQQNR